jgi:hypothetical protein
MLLTNCAPLPHVKCFPQRQLPRRTFCDRQHHLLPVTSAAKENRREEAHHTFPCAKHLFSFRSRCFFFLSFICLFLAFGRRALVPFACVHFCAHSNSPSTTRQAEHKSEVEVEDPVRKELERYADVELKKVGLISFARGGFKSRTSWLILSGSLLLLVKLPRQSLALLLLLRLLLLELLMLRL